MRVKLIFVERDFRGKDLCTREEVLNCDSEKSLTRNHVAKLIARHHPELEHAGGLWLLDASESVRAEAEQLGRIDMDLLSSY